MSSRTNLQFGLHSRWSARHENNFANLNCDFVFPGAARPFGRDVEYVSPPADFGVQQALGSQVVLDASVYHKSHLQPYVYRIESVTDPTTGGTRDVVVLTSYDDPGTGLDTRLVWSHRSTVTASLTYSLLRTPPVSGSGSPNVTTSAASGFLMVRVPNGWNSGTALGRSEPERRRHSVTSGSLHASCEWVQVPCGHQPGLRGRPISSSTSSATKTPI
jgi:hypothetical protein